MHLHSPARPESPGAPRPQAAPATAAPPAPRYASPGRYEISYASPGQRAAQAAPDEEAALHAARRMSSGGDLVDVTLLLEGGSRRLVSTFVDGHPLIRPGHLVPAAADAACVPAVDRAVARQYPDGIAALLAVAASGGPLRPRRLLYPDGTRLACWPAGRAGPAFPAVASGVIPASGALAPGWLQVARRAGRDRRDGLVTLHPALIAPYGADPAACLSYRQRQRYGEFDAAEADGRSSARLPAQLVDAGDVVCAGQPAGAELAEVTEVAGQPAGVVRVTAESFAGGTMTARYQPRQLVEVMIPGAHPAERGPQASRLFAPARGPAALAGPAPSRPGSPGADPAPT